MLSDYIIVIILGYLSGSVPYGLLFTKMVGLGDIRDIGSGNIGSTNVLRTGNKPIAAMTLFADATKAALPIMIFQQYGMAAEIYLWAGLAAFFGHLFPIWLKFKGGKGIACYIGIMLAALPLAGLVFAGSWLMTAVLYRISSLAALMASVITPAFLFVIGVQNIAMLATALSVIVVWTHRQNIQRLWQGEEPRIGQKNGD